MRIAVIGAGVIGATLAARLAEKGAEVTLIDQAAPGSGTSATSYAWVNANGKAPRAYHELNLAGLAAHARLSPQDGTGWFVRAGHVEIAADPIHQAELARRAEVLRDWGYGVEELTRAQACDLLPDLHLPAEARLILRYPGEGHADPQIYIGHMLDAARRAGAMLLTGAAVVGLRAAPGGAEVTLADGRVLAVDRVVSAVGRWTRAVAALAGAEVPVREFAEPGDVVVGYLATTNPLPVRLSGLVTTSHLNIRPAGGGRLMLQALDLDATADPRDVPGPGSELAQILLGRLRDTLRHTEGARIAEIVVGQRAMPADGRTIAGPVPGAPWLYVVATHSGVTLAPYLGEAVSAEIFGQVQAALAPFRPDRFRPDRFRDDAATAPAAPRQPGQQ